MDWAEYKRLADTPGVWSRWMLEQTLELLRHPLLGLPAAQGSGCNYAHLAVRVQACLDQSPVTKPADHKGGASVDMFWLQLEQAEAQSLLALVQRATQLGITTSGTAQRGLGGFVAAWQEYLTSLDTKN